MLNFLIRYGAGAPLFFNSCARLMKFKLVLCIIEYLNSCQFIFSFIALLIGNPTKHEIEISRLAHGD
jgi:hypothetical protein